MSILTPQSFFGSDLATVQERATVLLSNIERDRNEGASFVGIKEAFVEVYKIGQKYYNLDAEESKLDDREIGILMECAVKVRDSDWLNSVNENVRGIAEICILYITVLMIMDTSKYLIDSALNLFNDISYYDKVLSRKHLTILYFIQTLPNRLFDFMLEVKNVDIKKTVEVPYWIPESCKRLAYELMGWMKSASKMINETIETFIKSPTTFIIEKQNSSRSLFNNFWNSTFKLPYFYSRYEIENKRKRLVTLKKENITKLGYLFHNVPSYENGKLGISVLNNCIGLLNDNQYSFDNNAASIGGLIEFIQIRGALIDKLKRQEMLDGTPSYWTRNWPLYLVGGIVALSYIPSVVYNVHLLATNEKSRQESFEYFQNIGIYIYETSLSFWNHWIIDPINNILKTIRHDDNSEIALMSQKSLETDLKSLERMVMEYINDCGISVDDQAAIIENIKYGDLGVVMSEYEKDLKTPIKSIVRGDMLRNLLIQIQKTKVDGTLALNGVDKILKSQELVFGFVAASPSILILIMLKNTLMSWYNGENAQKSEKLKHVEICNRVCRSLGSVEKLIDQMVVNVRKGGKLEGEDCYKIGLLFIEVKNLKKLASSILPPYIYETFDCDVDELLSQEVEIEYKLLTIQRMWNVYGYYFK